MKYKFIKRGGGISTNINVLKQDGTKINEIKFEKNTNEVSLMMVA